MFLYQKAKKIVYKILNYIIKIDKQLLVFIPHGGCMLDKYNSKNYKSDNSLSLFNYIINKDKDKYKYRIAVDYNEYSEQQILIKNLYPDLDVDCFPLFNIPNDRKSYFKWEFNIIFKIFSKAHYIISSESRPLPIKKKQQKYIILGYYIPFKNDYNISYINHSRVNYKKICDFYITTSLLSSQIISHTYDIPLYKFKVLGFSRNDNLLLNFDNKLLESYIKSLVNYKINKIILYTPTHRDYERIEEQKESRSLIGFKFHKDSLQSFLEKNGIIIICKLHSAQNTAAIRKSMPKGVISFESNNSYGLCELMQYSDALLTDYTSAYFDYLLLDKPVIFNFYDFDKYKDYRGFSFDPIDSILAGDIIKDEISLYQALENIINNNDKWRDKRLFVKELVHKYLDKNSSDRIYSFLFKE